MLTFYENGRVFQIWEYSTIFFVIFGEKQVQRLLRTPIQESYCRQINYNLYFMGMDSLFLPADRVL